MPNQLKLSRRQQVEIQNLGNRKEALEKQLFQARSEIAESRQRLAEASDQLAQLPPPCDPAPLAEAIRAARSQGNLSQQAAALRAEIAALAKQASIDLNKLGLWSGSLEALEKLALPAAETIARFDRSLAEAQAAIARVQGQLEKARGDAADIERDLERLRLEGEVPSEAELAEARKLRDAGWQLVLRDWRKEAIDTTALQDFLAKVFGTLRVPLGGGTRSVPDTFDLAAAYEQTVRRADDLSDRLRREANRVAQRATLQAQQLSLQQQTAELGRQHAAAAGATPAHRSPVAAIVAVGRHRSAAAAGDAGLDPAATGVGPAGPDDPATHGVARATGRADRRALPADAVVP